MKRLVLILIFLSSILEAQYYIQRQYQSPADSYIPLNTSVTVVAEGYTEWGNEAYIKYTTDNWATIQFAYMTCDWQGTYGIYTGVIPAQSTYTKVEYGVIINSDNTPEDGVQLAYDFNNGLNYKFTITNLGGGYVTVTLIQPNGGETIQGNYQIQWNATESGGASAYITNNIYYTTNNGINWYPIILNYGNTGYYNWNTTILPNGNNYKIKIISRYKGETNSDISDNTFSINNTTGYIDIEIVQPDGGEIVSGNYEVKWSAIESGGYSSLITNNLYYTTNNGVSWIPIVLDYCENYNSGYFTYTWNTYSVPNSQNYKIKIESRYSGELDTDISLNTFTITNTGGTPWLLVNNLGNSNVAVNSNFQIEVLINSNNIYNLFGVNIGFEMSQDNLSFEGIEIETNNSQFLISDPDGTKRPFKYLWKSYINDNNRKVINFGITFLATNNNFQNATVSGVGKLARLNFRAIASGICALRFYNQAFYKDVVDTGTWIPYEITPVNTQPPPQCIINVIGNSPPDLTIIYPTGGEMLSGGVNIQWYASDPEGNDFFIDIDISADNGATWSNIASHLNQFPEQYYLDTTLFPDGDSYKIRIKATDTLYDSTIKVTGSFSIVNDTTPPLVTYVYPTLNKDSVVLPDFGAGVSSTNGVILCFSKSMDTNSLLQGFKITNKSTGEIITNGTFIWSDNYRKLIYKLPTGKYLQGNTEYRLLLDSTVVKDKNGLFLEPNQGDYFNVNFKTVIITNEGGVATSDDNNVTANILPNFLPKNIYLNIVSDKLRGIISANKILNGENIYHFIIKGDTDSNGRIDENDTNPLTEGVNLPGFTEIEFKYQDSDEDGVVDYTRISVDSLAIYRLTGNSWEKVQDGGRNGVDKNKKTVIADVRYLSSYYAVFGEEVNFTVNEIEVFPNPIDFSISDSIKFKKIPTDAIIRIYDVSGTLIKTLIPEGAKTDCHWYGKDEYGNKVPYGLYIYVIKTPNENKIGKIAVIK